MACGFANTGRGGQPSFAGTTASGSRADSRPSRLPRNGEFDTVGTAATGERIDCRRVIFAASRPGGRYRRRHAEIGKLAAIAAKYGVTIEPPTPERWSA